MSALVETFVVPPFGENTYLVGDGASGEAAVFDPGGRVAEVVATAERRGWRIVRILNTHAHIDHVTGVAALQRATGAPFALHALAAASLGDVPEVARRYGLPAPEVPEVDDEIRGGDAVRVGAIEYEVRDTPGHAPGHVTFVCRAFPTAEGPGPVAFCGDVIFLGSIGRTDLEGGDYDTLLEAIEREILTLPPETVLYSGHGPATTVGRERAANPFVREWLSRTRPSS